MLASGGESLERSEGHWKRLGASWRYVGTILGHVEASRASLEAILGSRGPSSSHLGPTRTLDTSWGAPSKPRGGYGEG
eukprot:579178-Pyramimonas_sp.AAC.1